MLPSISNLATRLSSAAEILTCFRSASLVLMPQSCSVDPPASTPLLHPSKSRRTLAATVVGPSPGRCVPSGGAGPTRRRSPIRLLRGPLGQEFPVNRASVQELKASSGARRPPPRVGQGQRRTVPASVRHGLLPGRAALPRVVPP